MGIHFVQLAVLARLLSAEDFGLMAMIGVVVSYGQAYADMGISSAIIHRQDTSNEQLSSLYWLNILSGSVIFLIILGSSPIIVAIFGEPRLSVLLPWSALIFLISPIGHQFQILLQKELMFKHLGIIEIGSSFIGFVITASLALLGMGVFSLIIGQIATTGVRALILATIGFRRWRPQFRFVKTDLSGYVSFGLYQMGEKSINYLNTNLDKLLIGSLLGAQALGYYSLAWSLIIQPSAKINPVITKVAFPVFAKIQDNVKRLQTGYLTVLKMLNVVNFPLMIGLAATAHVFVPVVFGKQWIAIIPLVQVLSFVGLSRSTGNPVGSLLLAKGRADLGFKWNLLLLFLQIPGIFVGGALAGLIGVAIALLVLQIIYFLPSYHLLIKPLLQCTLTQYVQAMTHAFVSSLVMGGALLILINVLDIVGLGTLVLSIFLGIIIYLLTLLLLDSHFFFEIRRTLCAGDARIGTP